MKSLLDRELFVLTGCWKDTHNTKKEAQMSAGLKLAVTGDTIITRKISVIEDDDFLALVKIIQGADIGYTHFESLVHDYEGPEIYPAADAGFAWMRSPRFVVEELKWAGFDIVSHASNHCMGYSYGGLMSTWKAFNDAGMAYAGTGMNLGEARDAAYVETSKGRVALISMCSSFTGWARAGEARRDMKGRPGLNPLRYHYAVDREQLEIIKQLATKFGWWITNCGQEWLFNPAGLHNAVYRLVEGKGVGVVPVADEGDVEGNLRSIRNAKRQADYVLVHLHNHEWDPDEGIQKPPKFTPPFARACIDAGADVFIAEGSHAPLRGIELYKNRVIFYDPGDFMTMSNTVTRLPADSYFRPGYSAEIRGWEATPADNLDAKSALPKPLNPPGGYRTAPFNAGVVGLCCLGNAGDLISLQLYPFTIRSQPRPRCGIPFMANPELGAKIIGYLGELSAPFGTKIEYQEGVGVVRI